MTCFFGKHKWAGCVCSRCGEVRHSFEPVGEEILEGTGCCWDVTQPCIGPHCGVPCDNYYPGRAGTRTVTLRCRACGKEKQQTEYVEDPV